MSRTHRQSAPPSCPCGSGSSYAACCGRRHAGEPAASAEALMRSRYSAYVQGLTAYLLATWHPSTRPTEAELRSGQDRATRWLGLSVLACRDDGSDAATVEFIARFRVGGQPARRLHEISRFRREDGCWLYLDGEFPEPADSSPRR